jgi:hypothetical protein
MLYRNYKFSISIPLSLYKNNNMFFYFSPFTACQAIAGDEQKKIKAKCLNKNEGTA